MTQEIYNDLKATLAIDRSAESRAYWAQRLIKEQVPIEELLPLLDEEHPIGMRFTWIWGSIITQNAQYLAPIVSPCFERRNDITFPGYKRSIAKMLCMVGVPEELEGLVVDELFKWILNPKIKVAVKVFAIDTIAQLAVKYPELKEELLLVIEDQWDKNSAAFRARAKHIRKRLDKL